MNKLKLHITFKSLALLLAMAVLSPYAVKLSHAFSHHTHEVCDGFSNTHFHKLDLDCEFYKFKLQKDSLFVANDFTETDVLITINFLDTIYFFSYPHQHLSFSLRAPPELV